MWPFGRRKQRTVGQTGERLARRHLKRRGLKILATNYRCPRGEVDLIVLDRSTRREIDAETIAFVEVKTRTSDKYTDPDSAVDADKRRRVENVADHYLAAHDTEEYNIRFDIVSVVLRDGQTPKIDHIPDAF